MHGYNQQIQRMSILWFLLLLWTNWPPSIHIKQYTQCDITTVIATTMMETDTCIICSNPLTDLPTVKLRVKGCESINRVSQENNLKVHVNPGQEIHKECRIKFIHKRNVHDTIVNEIDKKSSTRSSVDIFNFEDKCLFCSKYAKVNKRKRAHDVFPVRTMEFQDNIKQLCLERNDVWAQEVLGRISHVIDLPAADAVYHQQCSINFRTFKNTPKKFEQSKRQCRKSTGRPIRIDASEAFIDVTNFIKENEGSVLTMSELIFLMEDVCDNSYSHKHMKKRLIEYFGDSISITSTGGKSETKVTLKRTISEIIEEFSKNVQGMTDEEKKKSIISAAGKFIKSDISALDSEDMKKNYPSFSTVSSNAENIKHVPDSLQTLLRSVITGKGNAKKVASIGQAIVQSSRPKTYLAPLQVGLGVQLHHMFGSRYLIDLLSTLGFCISYFEVKRFEGNAATTLNTSIPSFEHGKCLQFVADNADHNIRTIDGHGTFHGMGIIACTSPGSNISIPIPRKNVSLKEVTDLGKINIKYFKIPEETNSTIYFKDIHITGGQEENYDQFNLFSKIIWPLNTLRPSWSGFMQMYYKPEASQHSEKSSVTFLPMIDLNPSDMSCINTTLHFVTDQSRKYGVTPILTFDQPLYQKAFQIVNASVSTSPLKNIVLRLGAFHTEMSFLGTIGYLMSGSGLEDMLQMVYAQNAVTHMLTGKSVSRAIRGHFLVDNALHTLLLQKVYPEEMENTPLRKEAQQLMSYDNGGLQTVAVAEEFGNEHIDTDTASIGHLECQIDLLGKNDNSQKSSCSYKERNLYEGPEESHCGADVPSNLFTSLSSLYDKLKTENISKTEICDDSNLKRVSQALTAKQCSMGKNRTAVLWYQYMTMIRILQEFIRSERIGDWYGHLNALKKMLPFFAASGHYLYLKSSYIYLQNMLKLESEHPDVLQHFVQGNHTIRRTDKYWGGLSTDLIIEQVLMRSMKTSGGLTRGRGLSEHQRATWLMAMPACAEMNLAMQEFSNTSHTSSEQHKDNSVTRCKRDCEDVKKILYFLQDHCPFNESEQTLRNIVTGVSADNKVNVDQAFEVGNKIVNDMVDQPVSEYVYKKAYKAVPLSNTNCVKIHDEAVNIDPQLLFQRLITIADRCDEDVAAMFKYELSTYPSSLFDNTGLLRSGQKSQLADAMWKLGDCGPDVTEEVVDTVYVIDGGSLLHKIPWTKDTTFDSICNQYYQYLSQKYTNTIVVFDGYSNGPSTKDVAHVRRTTGHVDTQVKFSNETPFRSCKDSFLKNPENKQCFITLLGNYLTEKDIIVKHAESDADLLIVETALIFAETRKTFIIGEDTDILVLLCYHANEQSSIFFRSDIHNARFKKRKIWDIQKTKRLLTQKVCDCLPVLHAFTGCDTTSRVFGIGKASALKLLLKDCEFQKMCSTFLTCESTTDVIKCGEKLMIMLLDGRSDQDLDTLRFEKFNIKVAVSASSVQVQTLPPTSSAAKFHSMRVFYQCQVWLRNDSLKPEEWGWHLVNDIYVPIKTDKPVAPEKLLNVVRCKCKTNCDTKRCTCRKNGLECSYSCGICRGLSCGNSITIHLQEEV